jgi:hypothetical protein
MLVGWRELAGLPDLGVDAIKAKIDTGARTSAIHASAIEPFTRDGAAWVAFEVHPLQDEVAARVRCAAQVHDERAVKSSAGRAERRYVIRTTLALGEEAWPIELTLARRAAMRFRMLIGRSALAGRAVIDPARSFVCAPPRGPS